MKILIITLICFSLSLYSQDDTPLTPYKKSTANLQDIGVMFGFGQNYSNGDHFVDCESCLFNGGVGFGTTLGLYYEREATSWLWYGLLIRYDNLGIESKYIDNQVLKAKDSEKTFIVPIEQKAVMDLSFVNFTPYASLRFTDWFRLNLGLNAGFNVSSNVLHTETPVNNSIQDPETGDYYELEVTNPDQSKTGKDVYVFMDSELPEMQSPYLTLYTNFAFPIEFENESKLIPSIGFDFPLGQISTFGNDFSIGTWRIFLSYSYPLVTRGKKEVK